MPRIHITSEIIHDKVLAMINRGDFLSSGCMTHFYQIYYSIAFLDEKEEI